jgi:hypothetical protein
VQQWHELAEQLVDVGDLRPQHRILSRKQKGAGFNDPRASP